LFYLSLTIFAVYSLLFVLSLKRVRLALLANSLVASIVLIGTFSSRTHFEFSESPTTAIAAAIVFISIPVQALLAAVSLRAYLVLRKERT